MKRGTQNKIKFKRLACRLKKPLYQVMGLLTALWDATVTNAPAGNIGRLDNKDIAAALEWEGDADELIDALVDAQWLDRDDRPAAAGGYRLVVHQWSEHCPDYVRSMVKRMKLEFADVVLSNLEYKKTKKSAEASIYQQVDRPISQPIDARVCVPNSSLGLPRPSEEPNGSSAAIDAKPSTSARASGKPEKLRWIQGNSGWQGTGFTGVTTGLLGEFSQAYPAVDVARHIRAADQWLKANPKNRKSNYRRFLNNWLKTEQDRAPPCRQGSTSTGPTPAQTQAAKRKAEDERVLMEIEAEKGLRA